MFCFSKCTATPPPPPPPPPKFQYRSGSFQGDEFEDRDSASAPPNKSTMRIQEAPEKQPTQQPDKQPDRISERQTSTTQEILKESGVKVDVEDYDDL